MKTSEETPARAPVSKEQAPPPDWLPETWHVWLSNGKRITASEEKLDAYYGGWRDLPERTAA